MEKQFETLEKLRHFVVVPSETPVQVNDTLEDINRQIKALNSCGRRPKFAFENTPEQIKAQIEELLVQKFEAEKKLMHFFMASKGYTEELDYSPLGWLKKETDLPAFFIIDVRHRSVTLSVVHEYHNVESFDLIGDYNLSKQYPQSITKLYREASRLLAKKFGTNSFSTYRTNISTKFQGILPDATRTKINQAVKSRLFNNIFIIAEAEDWVVDSIVIATKDPLVVGWVNKTSQMFYIDYFDPTPLETYVKEQHTL